MSNELIKNNEAIILPIAEQLFKSGFFNDVKSASQAYAKILAGKEMGIGAFASMQGINIIQGKVALGSNLIAGKIKSSGKYNYRIKTLTNEKCEIDFYENGVLIGTQGYTWNDATVAGLNSKAVWKANPRNMLFARCISNGAKWFCSDVFLGGVYTPEELGAEVNENEEVISIPAEDINQINVQEIEPVSHPILEAMPGSKKISFEPSEAQVKRLYAIANANGLSNDDVHFLLDQWYGKKSTKELSLQEYQELCGDDKKQIRSRLVKESIIRKGEKATAEL